MGRYRKVHIKTMIGTSIVGIVLLLLITNYSPDQNIAKIPTIILFFILFYSTIFSLVLTTCMRKSQAILIATTTTLILLLRLFNFTDAFYTIILVALFATIELILINTKTEKKGETNKEE